MDILNSIAWRYHSWALSRKCAGILKVPPIQTTDAPLVFVSQLQHKDLFPYLLAIKSVFRSFEEGKVIVVDDGSLTSKDIRILKTHVLGIEIRPIHSVYMHGLQSGGTWERLVTLINESQNSYAIQVDADIVALENLDEVVECVKKEVSFALTDQDAPDLGDLLAVRDWWIGAGINDHVGRKHLQCVCELEMYNLKNASSRKYLKATSAFAGIAPGAANIEMLVDYSSEMTELLGERWYEWGSEQVSSNYVIANTPKCMRLPSQAYMNYFPGSKCSDAKLVHFFGTNRFSQGRYMKAVDKVLTSIRQ